MTRIYSESENRRWVAGLPKKSIGVKAIIKSDQGRVLIVKPNYKNVWQLPGGVVEAGEEPKAALVREIHEEVGLVVRPAELTVINTLYRAKDDFLFLIYEYGSIVLEDAPLMLQDDELEGYKFEVVDKVKGQLSDHWAGFWDSYKGALA